MSYHCLGQPQALSACTGSKQAGARPRGILPTVRQWLTDKLRPGPIVLALLTGLAATPALAVHNEGLFELDQPTTCTDKDGPFNCGAANVADDSTGMPDDWANIFNNTSSAFASAFITDPVTQKLENSFFDQGGSKDEEAIDGSLGANKSWLYDNTNDVIPDKDDIEHAFAAAYKKTIDGKEHVFFYFGADRYNAGEGDSQLGFWFFRNQISLGAKPNFVGVHAVGDILVLADFVKGGNVGNVSIYKVTSITNNKGVLTGVPTLALVASKDGADCAKLGSGADSACAIVNNLAGELPPWSYTNKEGTNKYEVGALFEGGIDLTALGLDLGCFSTFLAETRSSHSLDAQLKDFAMGSFDVCSIKVVKTGTELSKSGDKADYTITITNTGAQTLWKKNISDDVLGVITANGVDNPDIYPPVVSNGCGASLAAGATCVVTLSQTASGNPDPLINTVKILYTEKSDFTGIALAGTSSHELNLFQPKIALSKSVKPDVSHDNPIEVKQGESATYTIKLENLSSSDTPALNCTLTDQYIGVSENYAPLLPGDSKTVTKSKLFIEINPDKYNEGKDPPWCTAAIGGTECVNVAKVNCSIDGGYSNTLQKEATAKVLITPRIVKVSITKAAKDYAKVGDKVRYDFEVTSLSDVPTTVTTLFDDVLGDLKQAFVDKCGDLNLAAAPDADSKCSFSVYRTVLSGDPDPLKNIVTVELTDPVLSISASASANDTVDLVHPDFSISKSCVKDPVPAGASVNFDIKVTNIGDPELLLAVSDPAINLDSSGIALGTVKNGACLYDGDASDGCLLLSGSMTASGSEVSNTAYGTATLPEFYDLPNVIKHDDSATCKVEQGGATRTPGFWQTHGFDGGYTCHVLADHLSGSVNLGWITLQDCGDVMGVFWANAAKNSNNSKRSQLCQATELASFQLLAAILNSGLDNGKPLPTDPVSGLNLIAAEQQALDYCYDGDSTTVCDRNNILRLKTLLGDYNGSGDSTAIIDNDGTKVAPADPQASRSHADIAVADCATK